MGATSIRRVAGRWMGLSVVLLAGILPAPASASSPGVPTITEPAADGQVVHPADVHMEAAGFSDADGDPHQCSDWQILEGAVVVWRASCAAGGERVHVHLGDGAFVGAYSGQQALAFESSYTLRVRFVDSTNEAGAFAERPFATYPKHFAGGAVSWTPTQAGFVVEPVSSAFRLPLSIAFVPNPGGGAHDPVLYVGGLYGTIRVLRRDGTVSDYAAGLLNFDPTGPFPGSGAQGLTGLAVDPASGDVFASMVYDAGPDHYPKVDRFHSDDGGLTASSRTTILDMAGEIQYQSHTISNVSIGPDGNLYVHNGDGFDFSKPLDLDSYRGKILRLDLNGNPLPDNPFYNGPPDDARDYIWAYGFRNPFGGAWRSSNGAHYEVENGPTNDRLARVEEGFSYGYDGSDESMRTHALYNWQPAHAPISIAFVQEQTFDGSGFPASKLDHAFVTESGPTYAAGPQPLGKRVVEFRPQPGGELGGHPISLLEYTGKGPATAAGLAAGPDGLYFTELFRERGATSSIDPGARLMRIRYAGVSPLCTVLGTTLRIRIRRGTARIRSHRNGSISVNGRTCGATRRGMDTIRVRGRRGNQRFVVDLRGAGFAPGATPERRGVAEIEIRVALGPGRGDLLLVRPGRRSIHRGGGGIRLNRDRDRDLITAGVERLRLGARR